MRFMEKCRDIEYITFNKIIWKKLTTEEKIAIDKICDEKLNKYFS